MKNWSKLLIKTRVEISKYHLLNNCSYYFLLFGSFVVGLVSVETKNTYVLDNPRSRNYYSYELKIKWIHKRILTNIGLLLNKFMTIEILFFELPVISIVCISVVPITIYIIPIPVVLIFVLAMILSLIFGVFIISMSIVRIVVIVFHMIVFVSGIKLSILDFLKITWRKRLKKDINFLLLWLWLRVTL